MVARKAVTLGARMEKRDPTGTTEDAEEDASSAADDVVPEVVDDDEEPDPDSTAVVSYDPLQRYLTEIRRYPLLSREEEKELAIRYKQEGDLDAAYRLVTANLRLVVMVAREYQRAFRNLLDLVQEGNIGLMEAIKNFDPYRGVR